MKELLECTRRISVWSFAIGLLPSQMANLEVSRPTKVILERQNQSKGLPGVRCKGAGSPKGRGIGMEFGTDIIQTGGGKMLGTQFDHSLARALEMLYPEIQWKQWKFQHVSNHFWKDIKNQRDYFQWLSKELSFQRPEDWYRLKVSDITKNHGHGLLAHHFGNSLVKALQQVFPEYNWQLWRFSQVPKGYWDSNSNIQAYMHWLADQLNIQTLEDWNTVDVKQVAALKGAFLVQNYGGLEALLQAIYPLHSQAVQETSSIIGSKGQTFLLKMVEEFFPGKGDILTNYRHPDLSRQLDSSRLELDIFLPSLSLAFEYQGKQHFEWNFQFGSAASQQQRDYKKRKECIKLGITLIEIPYSWDHTSSSLLSLIRKQRPGSILFQLFVSLCPDLIAEDMTFERSMGQKVMNLAKPNQ